MTCPRHMSAVVAMLVICLSGHVFGFPVGPKPTKPPGVIVKLKRDAAGVSAAGTGGLRAIAPELNLYSVSITDGKTPQAKAAELRNLGGVEYAVPDEWVRLAVGRTLQQSRPPPPKRPPPPSPLKRPPPPPRQPPPPPLRRPPSPPPAALVPDDAFYKELWGLKRIRAPRAWGYARDSKTVKACIVDTGVKYNHPDLSVNLVPMTREWKLRNFDDNGHGTHVAGIMGAVGNNKAGVVGVSWGARILSCKALDSTGWGLISDVVECIQWCRSRGARVVNTSFELANKNIPLMEAIGNATAAGVFFAGAAGNSEFGANNNDKSNRYPGGYEFPGNVAVANMNANNQLNYNSNFGATTVQLAAPGTNILSTWIWRDYANQFYGFRTGTSMAAPYVAGAAALAMSASNGYLTNAQVADLLIKTSTPLPALKGKVVANGVINLERLVIRAIRAGQAAAAAEAAAKQQQQSTAG